MVEKVDDILQRLVELEHRLDPEVGLPAFSATLDAVVIANERQKILLVNETAEQMFGWGTGELIGKDVQTLIPQEYWPAHAAKQEQYFQQPEPRVFPQLEGLCADGSKIPIAISLSPLASNHGTLVMAIIRKREVVADDAIH
jgi:protein-histidine pros-kinase